MPPNVALNQIPFSISTRMGVVALEEQLHQMVCAGTLDLSTAQHDIATGLDRGLQKVFPHGETSPSEILLESLFRESTDAAGIIACRWHLSRVQNSDLMKSSPFWAQAAWERCIALVTPGCNVL